MRVNDLLFQYPFVGEEEFFLKYLKEGERIEDVDAEMAFRRPYLSENTTLTLLIRAGLRCKTNQIHALFHLHRNDTLSWQNMETIRLVMETHPQLNINDVHNTNVADYMVRVWRFRQALRLFVIRAMGYISRRYAAENGRHLAKMIGRVIWENRINSP
jgi:hypothetical protein